MRLPAHLDGLDPVSGMLWSISPSAGNSEGEKRNHPADSASPFPPCLHSRTTIKHRVTRFIAGGLLFLAASATHATAPVGATPGELEVTTRGSAKYTIPIVVSPGTRGIQPKLTLTYDSQAGNGFIGHGWSLGGLSVIHRCGASILLDGFKGGVKYDANDKFCLDGERLVNVGGNEYRTRHETWQRIFASDTSANPASFTVWAKDGYILEYGVTEDSRIQAQGSANVRVWALNRMTDRLGNYYTIQYQEDNANGDYRPDRIDYTGNAAQGLTPYNSVVFQYETRSDTPPRYEAGSVMKAMQRMTHVLSYTDNGNTLVRDYRLTYDNDGAVGRSRLISVQECGTDGVCLPATQFGWQNGAVGYATTPINLYWSTDKTNAAPIGFADIDGDGQLDFWGWHSDGNIHIRRWGTNGFGPETTLAWSTNKTAYGPIGFADINGDGRADFWGWLGNGNIRVRLSNGDGTFGFQKDTYWSTNKSDGPVGFADINGDGRADFWGWSNDGNVYIRLSNGDGTFNATVSPTSWGTDKSYGLTIAFADINDDGNADLIGERVISSANATAPNCGSTQFIRKEKRNSVRLSNSNGTFGAESPIMMSWYVYYEPSISMFMCYETHMLIANVNGDGNTDVFAWLSKGDGNFVAPPTSSFPTSGANIPLSSLVDINGDGMDDYLLYFDPTSQGNIYISLSNGDGSFSSSSFLISYEVSSFIGPIGFGDINGDGLADFYDWISDGNIRVFLANPIMPDLITSITNGLGEQRLLAYKPLTDETVHAQAPVQAYPYRAVNDDTYVVSAAGKSDGLGGHVNTYYRYGGQLMHVTANERLGFAWIQRTEPDGSWVNDFYNQDVDRFGTLSKSQTFVPGGVKTKETINTWGLGTSAYNRIMLRLFGSTEETYELDASLINRTTTTTDYDGYGYPTNTVVTQLDGRKKTTVNTYLHDETYWTLGLKTLEQVTAEAPGFALETRTTNYDYYPGNGLLALETVEPTDSAYTLAKSHGYDAFGNRTRTTVSGPGIVTRETTHVYDSTTGRFRVKTTNALGHYETLEYDPRNGEPAKHTGPNLLVTTWNYDGLGRKEKETRPDNTMTVITRGAWSGGDYVQTDTSGAGQSVVYRDILGRTVQEKHQGFGGTWSYAETQYDSLGRVAQVSAPHFSGETPLYTVNEYDALQRVKKVTAPGNRVTTTDYNGLTVAVTNPKYQVTTTIKDSEGHVVEVIDAASGHTRASYDAFGNLVQITDPAGNVTALKYDRLGRKIETNDPDRGKWTWTYSVLGELKKQTDAKNQITTHVYDKLGRLKSRSAPDSFSGWTYDTAANGKGKLAAVAGSYASETYTYDSLGRMTSDTTSVGGVTYTVAYTYDALSRVDTLTYPETGFAIKHRYDDPYSGRLKELQNAATSSTLWKIDPSGADARGRITSESFGNGLITRHAYDPLTGDLQTIQTGTATNPASVQSLNHTFDAVGNLTVRGWWDGATARSETFDYDNLNRLTSVTGPANKSFQYDAVDNLTHKSDVGTYTYPNNGARPHAVASIAGALNTSFTYDGNGNLLTGNGRTVTYYAFNQPKTIANASGTATFTYDANLRRVTKANASGTTIYIGKHYERITTGTTVTQNHFIYAGSRLIGLYSRYSNGTNSTRYFHPDALGSVEAMTSSTGGLTARYGYDAWGKRRYANGTDGNLNFGARKGYTGEEHDDDLALINLNAREYDPYLARFLEPDPLKEQGDPHPYAYANNNPLKYTDPTGTSSYDPWGMGGGYSYSSSNSSSWTSTGLFGGPSSWTSTGLFGGPSSWTSTGLFGGLSNSWSSSYSSNWSSYNSSSSLGSFGSGGIASTSYNTSWNSSGFGGYTSPYGTLGAGWSTGTPSSSYSWTNAIPFVSSFQQAANGNFWSALGSAALDFGTIFAPTRLLGVGADVGRVAGGVVIGENMTRVGSYASRIGAETFQGTGMAANRAWIQDARITGKQVFDIGPDFDRRLSRIEVGIQPDSLFYNMERMETSGYSGYQKLFERRGKYDGGVPGFDDLLP